MRKASLLPLANMDRDCRTRPTSQRCDGLAVALCSPQLPPSSEICEQCLFSKTCGQDAPILAEGYASSRINGLQCALDLVGGSDCRPLRHGVALVCCEPKVLLQDLERSTIKKFLIDDR